MTSHQRAYDAVIIGGGFYGAAIAIYLRKYRDLKQILVIEKESNLLSRASYNNQARVHNGYHYPRSFTTAYRSRCNSPQFLKNWPGTIKRDFIKLYAIARRNSKITSKQFERFSEEIGARLEPAEPALRDLFEPRLIEDVFMAEEYAFDATKLAKWIDQSILENGIKVQLEVRVKSISNGPDQLLKVFTNTREGAEECITSSYVFNCSYSGLNQIEGDFKGTRTALKHELTEMALLDVPANLKKLGVTVMDGPFFSMMPFPARGLHTLSHVRYTPHMNWKDYPGVDPYEKLNKFDRITRVDRMLRDAGRFLPSILQAKYIESIYEVKTILVKNEGDDGRPILFEKHPELHGCYSILGGKIDNIFDIFQKLDSESIATKGFRKRNGARND